MAKVTELYQLMEQGLDANADLGWLPDRCASSEGGLAGQLFQEPESPLRAMQQ